MTEPASCQIAPQRRWPGLVAVAAARPAPTRRMRLRAARPERIELKASSRRGWRAGLVAG